MDPKCDLCIEELIPGRYPMTNLPVVISLRKCTHKFHLDCLTKYIQNDFVKKRKLLRCSVCTEKLMSIDLYYCKLHLEFIFRVHNTPWCRKKQWIMCLEKKIRKMWEEEKEYIDIVPREGEIKTN